jgi:hypothetical protein
MQSMDISLPLSPDAIREQSGTPINRYYVASLVSRLQIADQIHRKLHRRFGDFYETLDNFESASVALSLAITEGGCGKCVGNCETPHQVFIGRQRNLIKGSTVKPNSSDRTALIAISTEKSNNQAQYTMRDKRG